jgi:hypothetical protein
MNGAMKCAIRVVLVEHVILPIPLDQTVGIIQPIFCGQEMKNRTVPIGHHLHI